MQRPDDIRWWQRLIKKSIFIPCAFFNIFRRQSDKVYTLIHRFTFKNLSYGNTHIQEYLYKDTCYNAINSGAQLQVSLMSTNRGILYILQSICTMGYYAFYRKSGKELYVL